MTDNEHENPIVRVSESGKGPTLTITLMPDGQNVGVHGPLGNIALCYFMLERAKDAIRDYQKPRLVTPEGPIPPASLRP